MDLIAKHRAPVIAANWKMNKSDEEVKRFIVDIAKKISDIKDRKIIILPPSVYLKTAYKAARGTNVKIGAQNMFYENSGAYTGENSPVMVKEFCDYVLLGHSERRDIFKESNEIINKKIIKALSSGLHIIFCVGEHLEERESGRTNEILSGQIEIGLSSITETDLKSIIFAYEPVWAIGTGKTATPEIAEAAHKFIRDKISKIYSKKAADHIRIIYGGSVKPDNIKSLMRRKDIDGALVGGASLDIASFENIVKYDK
jgi:triosephosphate isomerase (TIM)